VATLLATSITVPSPGFAADLCSFEWSQYSDPSNRFVVSYPSMTHVEVVREELPRLLSRTIFVFNQPYGENQGSIDLSFKISIWQNTQRLTAETWVRQNTNPQLITSAAASRLVGNHHGVMLSTSNLAWSTVEIYVAETDRMYELSYFDLTSLETLIPDPVKSCWTSVFDQMVSSFTISRETR
jgi:hypothetical protein